MKAEDERRGEIIARADARAKAITDAFFEKARAGS